MKIAYVVYWNGAGDGVSAKVATHLELWREGGHEVTLFRLSRGDAVAIDERERGFAFTGARERIAATRRLAAAVKAHAPDAVYFRYDHFVPPLRSLPASLPTVVELNESRSEYRLRSRAAAAYDRLNRAAVLGRARGVVAVTHEIAAEQPGQLPSAVIGNGVDLRRYEELPPATGARPRAVFLGSPRMPWHGLDKIIDLAALLPAVDFDVVGTSEAELPRHPPNVRLHGFLAPAEYRPILAAADLGIGTLAFHRTGLAEGSPLKTREYLALGLPVVIGYRDTDLAGERPWFVCELPNQEDNARTRAGEILGFVEDVRGRRVAHAEVAERIDAAPKEERRLAFLEQAVRAAPAGRRS